MIDVDFTTLGNRSPERAPRSHRPFARSRLAFLGRVTVGCASLGLAALVGTACRAPIEDRVEEPIEVRAEVRVEEHVEAPQGTPRALVEEARAFADDVRPPAVGPERDREFYRALVADSAALPAGVDALTLTRDLQRWLGDPDPELRDTFAYGLPAVWIRRGLVPDAELRELVETWRPNLRAGVGETGGHGVLTRSFSALALDSALSRETRQPFLGPRAISGLVQDLVRYLERERDLRDRDPALGWIHATAHTADVLRRLVRLPDVDDAQRASVVDAIEKKLGAVGRVFTHGENRRLAAVLVAIVEHASADLESIVAWRARARERERRLWSTPDFDAALFARVENETQVFESLLAALTNRPADDSRAAAIRAACAGP